MFISGRNSVKLIHWFVLVALLCIKPALGQASGAGDDKASCKGRERQALLELKKGFIDDYGSLDSWGREAETKDCCKWRGVQCSKHTGHVVLLDLHGSADIYLGGNISSSLLELQHLRYLDLSSNEFEETPIPGFIGSLSRLQYLNLSSIGGLVGTVPHKLGNLSQLQNLDLGFNYDLEIREIGWLSHLSTLRYLNLSGVKLSEQINWVEVTSKLPLLRDLRLSACNLTDIRLLSSFPLNNSSLSLALLDLSSNSLTSSIYTRLFNFTGSSLVHLDLSGNDLQGPIFPSEPFAYLSSLAYLDLHSNKINGSIPEAFGNMTSLAFLDLSSNHLEGGLPRSFINLGSLQTLHLEDNNLTQQLPNLLEGLSGAAKKSLEILWLKNNQLSGSLPDFTAFSSLRELYLYENELNGTFPESFGHHSSLVILDLSKNRITGSLPDVTSFSSLRELHLEKNKLNGTLTETIGQLSKLEILKASSNSLTGTISEAHFLHLSNLKELDFSHNSLTFNLSPDWTPPFQLDILRLSRCQLGLHFPNWLQTQNNYSQLDISATGISGSVPKRFWDLSPRLLYLNLSYNHISATVPDLSLQLPYSVIDLSSNHFEGPLPLFLPQVQELLLFQNMFSGSISSLCSIANDALLYVDLSDNQLSGELPHCWTRMKELVLLNLANNNLSGKIPNSMGFLNRLRTLHLSNNSLTGELPASLKRCKELGIIDLGQNKLSGKIPEWIGTHLTSLVILSLTFNQLYGNIPTTICHLNQIRILDLSRNNISGNIPKCFDNFTALVQRNVSEKSYFSYQTYDGHLDFAATYTDHALVQLKGVKQVYKSSLRLVRSIDISVNGLVGEIPEEIWSLAELISLNLATNNLTGTINQHINKMKMLEFLDLSDNRLSGVIPASLADLTFLSRLNLSYNNLSGEIPSGTQLQGIAASAFVGNDELCGPPLAKKCPADHNEEEEEEEEDEDGFVSRGFYVSMGLGFGVGFGGVIGLLLLKNSWRHAYFEFLISIKDWLLVNIGRLHGRVKNYSSFSSTW